MKRFYTFVFFTLTCSICFSTTEIGIDISSVVSIRYLSGEIKHNEVSSRFSFSSKLAENTSVFSSILARFSVSAEDTTFVSSELGKIVYKEPTLFDLYECYIRIDGMILDNISLILGKQRIFWGKADKINPTDVLNPSDLYKPIEFSKKLPSWALNAKVFIPVLDETHVQLVLKPFSDSAKFGIPLIRRYNEEITDKVLGEIGKRIPFFRLRGISQPYGSLQDDLLSITNITAGIKVATRFLGFDLSTSFVTRENDMPLIRHLCVSNLITVKTNGSSLPDVEVYVNSIRYFMDYHRESMVGFDLSRDLGFAVGWFEIGVFIPEKMERFYSVSSEILTIASSGSGGYTTNTNYVVTNYSEVYLETFYTKYAIGFEKLFDDGYANLQFVHGIGMERGSSEEKPQDYLMLSIERKFFSSTLGIGGFVILNTDDVFQKFGESDIMKSFMDNLGYAFGVEISYYPVVGSKVFINLVNIEGNGKSRFVRFNDFDTISVGFSMEI
ncbi:MAG: hypothetical protein ABDH28_07935 [Brevinematia bacterium]